MRHKLEREFFKKGRLVAGLDEVGRGSLCGPVVACCVVLNLAKRIKGINDSKLLSSKKRTKLFLKIKDSCLDYGLGLVSAKVIDQINIRQATFLAMRKAIARLKVKPDLVLVDGESISDLGIKNIGIIKGDRKSISIAAASIIAKVVRDKIMNAFARRFLFYSLDKNKGYGTTAHFKAISKYGLSPIHRRSFRCIKECLR